MNAMFHSWISPVTFKHTTRKKLISRELLKLYNSFATIRNFLMPKFHFIVIDFERTEHDTFSGGFVLPFVRSGLEQTMGFREDRSGD